MSGWSQFKLISFEAISVLLSLNAAALLNVAYFAHSFGVVNVSLARLCWAAFWFLLGILPAGFFCISAYRFAHGRAPTWLLLAPISLTVTVAAYGVLQIALWMI